MVKLHALRALAVVTVSCLLGSGCLWSRINLADPLPAPFELDPGARAELDRVLQARQERYAQISSLGGRLTRWQYDTVFGPAEAPQSVDSGRFLYCRQAGTVFEIEGQRPEKWVWDGKMLHEFDHSRHVVRDWSIPAELAARSPWELAGVFSPLVPLWADAQAVKDRFYSRIVTPADAQGQVWLEVRPRTKQDAVQFERMKIILDSQTMLPVALQVRQPGGRCWTSHVLSDLAVDAPPKTQQDVASAAATPPGWRRETLNPFAHLPIPLAPN